MNFILPVITLCQREIVRFYRQRSRLLGALGTPVIFWLLIGSGIGASFRPPSAPQEMNFLEYFYPGTLLLIILFTSIFSTISVIEDRREGFLLSVLVSPIPRSALVVGKLMGGATLAFLQSVPFLLLAPAVGISLAMANLPALVFSLFLIAFVLTGLGFVFAWQIDSTQWLSRRNEPSTVPSMVAFRIRVSTLRSRQLDSVDHETQSSHLWGQFAPTCPLW